MKKTKNYITRDFVIILYSSISNLAWKLNAGNRGSSLWHNNRYNNK